MKKDRGQGLVEMALILPFLLILIIGIVEGGIALHHQLIVVNAAREGARFGSFGASPDAVCAQTLLATSGMIEFSEENAVIAVIRAKTSGTGDSFKSWRQNVYPEGAEVPHVARDDVLARLRVEGDASDLELIIVAVGYDHQSLLGLPLVGALADRIPISSWTAMRITALGKAPGCCALPITLPIWDVEGLEKGDELADVRVGDKPGQFGWLFWDPDEPGAGSAGILRANLRDRCRTEAFQDACDRAGRLKPGVWAWGDDGEMAGAMEEAKRLEGHYFPIPVWDEFKLCNVAECDHCQPGRKVTHIVGFVLMEITEVNLTGSPKTISVKFRGWYNGCE